ncbi:hypothetical protein HYQ44_014671 [Verticillium longisporum]|nr:hypothetical protein HYQ44_014671 [Verticillium longisporum]
MRSSFNCIDCSHPGHIVFVVYIFIVLTKFSRKMFGFDEAKDNYDNAYRGDHESKLSHEIVAGGAAFGAMKLFEDRQRKNGVPSFNHTTCKGFYQNVIILTLRCKP